MTVFTSSASTLIYTYNDILNNAEASNVEVMMKHTLSVNVQTPIGILSILKICRMYFSTL